MNVKICTTLLALALAAPVASLAAPATVDLGDIFASGDIAQALETEKKFKGTQNGGGGNAQGGNVVIGANNLDKSIAQGSEVGKKLKLTQNGGGGNNQALNMVLGTVQKKTAQGALIGGKVRLKQNGGGGNVQAVNLVNGCEDCGDDTGDGGGDA
jgi:hypothetical protein